MPLPPPPLGAAPPLRPAPVIRQVDHDDPRDRRRVIALLAEHLQAAAPPGPGGTGAGGDPAEARHRWLYRDNPSGAAVTFLALESGGEPVGLTSLFPRAVLVGGRVLVGSLGGDGYVRPAWRRRGIATALHGAALSHMEHGRVSFMFGPPEPANLRALQHAGATVVGAAQRWARPLRLRGLHRLAESLPRPLVSLIEERLRPRPTRLHLEPLGERPDSRVDEIWSRVASARGARRRVIPVRDAAFYAWRFGQAPARRQRGYLVVDGARALAAVALERTAERVAIVDVTAEPEQLRTALRAVLGACRDARSVVIEMHAPAPGRAALLASLGFLPRESKPFQVQAPPGHAARALLTAAGCWDYGWGDGDVDHVLS